MDRAQLLREMFVGLRGFLWTDHDSESTLFRTLFSVNYLLLLVITLFVGIKEGYGGRIILAMSLMNILQALVIAVFAGFIVDRVLVVLGKSQGLVDSQLSIYKDEQLANWMNRPLDRLILAGLSSAPYWTLLILFIFLVS